MSWRIKNDGTYLSDLKTRLAVESRKQCSDMNNKYNSKRFKTQPNINLRYSSKIQFNLTTIIPNIYIEKDEIKFFYIGINASQKQADSSSSIRNSIMNEKYLSSPYVYCEKRSLVRNKDDEKDSKRQRQQLHITGCILACGQNICGQIGMKPNIIERKKPQLVQLFNEENENIVQVCAGAIHSCALTQTGKVFTWGCNDDSALGRLTIEIEDEFQPKQIVLPEAILQIAAGDSFTFARGNSGTIYGCGCFRSTVGILGLLSPKNVEKLPIIIPFNEKIKTIACAADFCLFLTNNGEVYSFGNGETGQLGRDQNKSEYLTNNIIENWLRPSKIPTFENKFIENIWCGGHGFFVKIKEKNKAPYIMACGANSFTQLGIDTKTPVYEPIKVDNFSMIKNIQKIACGLQHTLILDYEGNVFGVGRVDDGRLGVLNLKHNISKPVNIKTLKSIVDIDAGGSVSFAIDQEGNVYSFGMGDTAQTGHGSEDIFEPKLIEGKQLYSRIIHRVTAGAQHTLFLATSK